MKLLLAFILTFSTCFAQVQKIEKGEPAPFTGAIVTAKQLSEFRKTREINIKLKDLQVVNEQRIEFYKEEAKHYQVQIKKERIKHFWEKAGYFALGVLVTGIAAKAAIESTR
tara:strand:+ start:976 stop:1311 length:336 start_codon:yes stop_codon:yes gene_type:complete